MDFDYSEAWFKSASLDELNDEREKVRLAFCSAGGDFELADSLEHLLDQFDSELRIRNDDGQPWEAPVKNSEHGWYLPDDD